MNLLAELRNYELRCVHAALDSNDLDTEESPETGVPNMYRTQPVRYEVRLDAGGHLRDVLPLGLEGYRWGIQMALPHLSRTSAIKPKLLVDNAAYALGYGSGKGGWAGEKIRQRHQAFKELVIACAANTRESAVQAVGTFLHQLDPIAFEAMLPADFDPKAQVIFSVLDTYPTDLSAVQGFWAQHVAGAASCNPETSRLSCLITGEPGTVMLTEPTKIRGLAGGKPTGNSLVTSYGPTVASYGLSQGQVAPIHPQAAQEYARGLNRLLADPASHLQIGELTYVWWGADGSVPLLGNLLQEPQRLGISGRGKGWQQVSQPQDIKEAVFNALFLGQRPALLPNTAYHFVALSANGSRVVIRSHYTHTLQQLLDHLARFLCLQATLQADSRPRYHSIYTLARSLTGYKPLASDLAALMGCALQGLPLPHSFLARLVARNRAEQRVTDVRATLTQMVLSTQKKELHDMDEKTEKEPAYHLGRLLATLENIQLSAIPDIKTTVTERYYASMSLSPSGVVGWLLSNAQNHLHTLRKNNLPAYYSQQRELQEILLQVGVMPTRSLTTFQQSIFGLGYYHQRFHIEQRIRANAKAKGESQ